MLPESHHDWLDDIAGPRPDPARIRDLQKPGTLTPPEQRRLDEELALNSLLDSHRPAPPVSSNFTSRVLSEIHRANPSKTRSSSWWHRIPRFATALSLAALVLIAGFTWSTTRTQSQLTELAQTALDVGQSTTVAGLDEISLADFDVIHRLGTESNPDDDALILALAQ
jgi:hypothetical protein